MTVPKGPKRSDGGAARRPPLGSSPRFGLGAEVVVTGPTPRRLVGRYGRVVGLDALWAQVEFDGALLYWLPMRSLGHAYGGEL